MLTALMSRVGSWFSKYVVSYVFRYALDFIIAYLERRRLQKEQELKDKKQNEIYKDTIKNGTEDNIVKETEKLLNG